MEQQISWRYITITGLSYFKLYDENDPNMDFPGFTFSGTMIPNTLQNIQDLID